MTELISVVAAVDDNDGARHALRIAALLADEANGGRLFAAHVVPPVPRSLEEILFPYACFGEDYDALRAELVQRTEQRLRKELGPLLKDGRTLRVVQGPVVRTLVDALATLGPDIVVLGPPAPGEPAVGAVGHAVARSSPVTTVLARATDAEPSLKRILVAVDLGPSTVPVVEAALLLAHRLDAQVQPVFVLPTAVDAAHEDFLPPERGVGGKTKKAITQRWLQIESQLDLPFPIESVRNERLRKYIATAGDPALKLVEMADEMNADMVVLGRPDGARLGRVAEHVARHAGAHVMLVPVDAAPAS